MDLTACMFVAILYCAYSGPFRVISVHDKYFATDKSGHTDTVLNGCKQYLLIFSIELEIRKIARFCI